MGRPATGHTPRRTFRCPDELWALVEDVAAARGCTASDVVRGALEREHARAKRRGELEADSSDASDGVPWCRENDCRDPVPCGKLTHFGSIRHCVNCMRPTAWGKLAP